MRQTSFLPCFSARVRVLTMILAFCTVVQDARSQTLDASVPYQDHDLLTNPMQGVFGADLGVYFNCDWQTFMAMILLMKR